MSLFRYLVQGFGWRVGARAAEELLEELDEQLPEEEAAEEASAETAPPSAWQRWNEARRVKKAEREREVEAVRAEKAIDDELEALKRKVGK